MIPYERRRRLKKGDHLIALDDHAGLHPVTLAARIHSAAMVAQVVFAGEEEERDWPILELFDVADDAFAARDARTADK